MFLCVLLGSMICSPLSLMKIMEKMWDTGGRKIISRQPQCCKSPIMSM